MADQTALQDFLDETALDTAADELASHLVGLGTTVTVACRTITAPTS